MVLPADEPMVLIVLNLLQCNIKMNFRILDVFLKL